jgi:hypothetical protein
LLEHVVGGLSKWGVWAMPLLEHVVAGLSKWSVWAMPLLGHTVTGLSKCSLTLQDQVEFMVYWHFDRFVSSTLVLPSQRHFTNALHSFIHLLLQPQKLGVCTHTNTQSNLILNTYFFHALGNKQDNEESKVNARTHDTIAKLYINNNLYVIIKLSG